MTPFGAGETNEGKHKDKRSTNGISQGMKDNISVYLVEDNIFGIRIDDDPAIVSRQLGKEEESFFDWIRNELESSVLKVIYHIEELLCNNISKSSFVGGTNSNGKNISSQRPRILSLTADFIMDNTKQLWLANMSNVTINSVQNISSLIKDDDWHNREGTRIEKNFDSGSYSTFAIFKQ